MSGGFEVWAVVEAPDVYCRSTEILSEAIMDGKYFRFSFSTDNVENLHGEMYKERNETKARSQHNKLG